MKSLHNIEKSGFHKGEYVGYCDGAWRIVKHGGMWRCVHQRGAYWSIEGKTLEAVSKALESTVYLVRK